MSSQPTYAAAWPYRSRSQKAFIHLMIQTPTTLFAYWEIPERRKQFIADHYRSSWYLLTKQVRLSQVCQLQEHSHPTLYWDVNVGESESWYFRHVQPNASYRIDYGILNVNNQFIALCCSNLAAAPRNEAALHSNRCTCSHIDDRFSIISSDNASIKPSTAHDVNSPFHQFSAYSLYTSTDLTDCKHLIERN